METRTYRVGVEVAVRMTAKGYPATGPTYSSGGEPGAGPEFETEEIYVDGEEVEDTIHEHYQGMIDRWEAEGCNKDAIRLLKLLARRESVLAKIEDAALDSANNDNGWMT